MHSTHHHAPTSHLQCHYIVIRGDDLSLPPNGSIHITQHVETMVVCARKYKMTSLEVRACQKQPLSAQPVKVHVGLSPHRLTVGFT